MGLDSRPDRIDSPVPSGIPGGRNQPQLGRQAFRPKSPARVGSFRSRRATRSLSCRWLNQLLADSMILYAYYNKYLWLVRDDASHDLRLLLGKHAGEQSELIGLIVQRVQALGGAPTVPGQVAELTLISRPPKEAEAVPEMLSRLAEASQLIIGRLRDAIRASAGCGDTPTEALLTEVLFRQQAQILSLDEYLDDDAAESA